MRSFTHFKLKCVIAIHILEMDKDSSEIKSFKSGMYKLSSYLFIQNVVICSLIVHRIIKFVFHT